ncbi:MAG TPA: hypothetical protein VGM88_32510 [Kofleriaceae bacterium]|jgi:hypothetical protein
MTRALFYGCPGWVGSVTGQTTCGVWLEKGPGSFTYNQKNLVNVNLANTPSQLDPSKWAACDVDDNLDNGGLTKIGPDLLEDAMSGAIYVVDRLWATMPNKATQWPPYPGTLDFQYEVAVYSQGADPLLRYVGYLATVQSHSGTKVLVAITEVGETKPAGPFWIDLADSKVCDPPTNGLTSINQQSPVGSSGALFVSMGEVGALGLKITKLPLGAGSEVLDR